MLTFSTTGTATPKTERMPLVSSTGNEHSDPPLVEPIVATHFEKIAHFEIFFQSALNLAPNQHSLKKNFKVR